MNLTRLNIFQSALTEAKKQKELYPKWQVLDSIIPQLEYLIKLESGELTDKERLKKIILGILAVRELDDQTPEFADLIHAASAEANQMQNEAAQII